MSTRVSDWSQIAASAIAAGVFVNILDANDTVTPPADADGSNKLIEIGELLPGLVWPSGDLTGVKDPANVAAALAACGSAVLMPGSYHAAVTVNVGAGQAVRTLGGYTATTWTIGGAFPAFTTANAGGYNANTPAEITGLDVDGSFATAGGSAVQVGDVVGLKLDLRLGNWTGGNTAAHFLNGNWFTEQSEVKLRIANCDTGVLLDQSGAGTNSYDRCRFDLLFNQNANQKGIVLGGSGTTGVNLIQGMLRARGNWTNSTSALTSSVISFTTSNAIIQGTRLEIGVEVDDIGGGATHLPQSINFKDASTVIQNCHGYVEFMNNGTNSKFAPSNNSGNFWFDGPVIGDPSLLVNVLAAPNTAVITTGFPTGWSGTITLSCPRGDGMVFWKNELQVNAGTVMTAFETLVSAAALAAAAPFALPANSRYCTVDINGYGSLILSTANGIRFVTPPGTPGATIFPYGQTTYRNS
jgi:hypothetical protein